MDIGDIPSSENEDEISTVPCNEGNLYVLFILPTI